MPKGISQTATQEVGMQIALLILLIVCKVIVAIIENDQD